MSTRVLKIEIRDHEGNKITVSFKGRLTRNKAFQLLDFVGLLGGIAANKPEDGDATSDLSKFKKLQLVIERRFPLGLFTSQEALVAYEDILNEPMGLSTVSTYLARLADQGFLSRSGSRIRRRYKMKERPSIREKQRIPP